MAPIKVLPPRELVRRLLDYDPMTGVFIWRPRPREMFPEAKSFHLWNARFSGKPAGWKSHEAISITVGGAAFIGHRLAWLYVYDEPVPDELDHADHDPSNNRIANLRAATRSQNNANAFARKHNTTGVKGVSRRRSKFAARIQLEGAASWLGTFDTVEEAAAAYREAAVRLYGEFARPSCSPRI